VRASRTAVSGSRRGASLVDDVVLDGRYGRWHRPSGAGNGSCGEEYGADRSCRRERKVLEGNDCVLAQRHARRWRDSCYGILVLKVGYFAVLV